MSNATPSPAQIRAAMALLRWDYRDLADAADVSVDSLSRICLEKHHATATTRAKLRRAFELRGIEFSENDGLRRRAQDVEIFEGPERFEDFTNFVYQHILQLGGDVCIQAVDEGRFREYRKDFEVYKKRMSDYVASGRGRVRIIAGASAFRSDWAEYRHEPSGGAPPIAFYAFGNCLALVSFDHTPAPDIVLHKSGPFAEAYRKSFELAWATAKSPPAP